MFWARRQLTRLAFSVQCREISDLARSFARAYGDEWMRGGELVEEADRLVRNAEHARVLAIAAERARGTSWEMIGESLGPDGVSKQAAAKRFGAAVDEIFEQILFPKRDGDGVMPGWWACPDGLEDPDRTVSELDAWAARHREPTDPVSDGDRLVSAGLENDRGSTTVELTGRVLELTQRLVDRNLPSGVSERTARRMLLEAKIEAYRAQLTDTPKTTERHRELVHLLDGSVGDLIAWHRDDLAPRLVAEAEPDVVRLRLDDRPVAFVERHNPPTGPDDEDAGWWVWPADGDGHADASKGTHWWLCEVVEPPGKVAERARVEILQSLATDLTKGVEPFSPGGFAGEGPPPA